MVNEFNSKVIRIYIQETFLDLIVVFDVHPGFRYVGLNTRVMVSEMSIDDT